MYNYGVVKAESLLFDHMACGSCAAGRREPCQAGNRAALSG